MEKKIKENELKTIAYDYLFNYFGKDIFKGKVITGASIQLAIKAYKNGEEVKFKEEPKANNCFYCDNFKVSFDTDKLYVIEKNIIVDNLYRIIYGWDKIDYEVIGFSLDYLDESPNEELQELLKGIPCSAPMEVSKEQFETFLKEHIEDFNIKDNINAQVPSISFIETD
ncbi:hypothetical protein FDB50_15515 [Clostridium botulinum]|uniref:Uncharacterized protein n=1 Tax=Clostridium botulinum TaxID=1491 RepID=A0A846JXN6_CLOBO|nr:hypothetical protein [Clostridium botulinum]NFL39289.1 hypothetical protein [Clostridium botulinum]NFL65833.1 hypothetical protein [Clostridium botulinum]NFN06112.1 hypothetical protein [Clostridium botulinum]NFN36448.1 hypothetical protein [Clostridium botulinum]